MPTPIQALAVLNVVGLSGSLLHHAPHLRALATQGNATRLQPVLPAVTCSVQSSMLTGRTPQQHGIVGNGWFDSDLQEIHFWKQSNRLVHGEKVWDTARRIAHQRGQNFRAANLFWWFNMASSVDVAVTPRPQYRADGQKVPDLWTHPPQLRDTLQRVPPHGLGRFPLFNFWGPASNLTSSRWIANATIRTVTQHDPTLTLVYLPHLDYALQKLGPDHPDVPQHVAAIDAIAGDLIAFFHKNGRRIIALSEYGIEAVHQPINVNRHLRHAGLLAVREENGRELLDPMASRAFAVADHQVAHVYHAPHVTLPDIPHCTTARIDHPRAGNTVLVADPGAWFTYDYWPADQPHRAPDFARTVDIHRKPGYDPRELHLGVTPFSLAAKLLRRKLGFRTLLDVIPLDASRVKGSHGRTDNPPDVQPVMLGDHLITQQTCPCTSVRDVILHAMFGEIADHL